MLQLYYFVGSPFSTSCKKVPSLMQCCCLWYQHAFPWRGITLYTMWEKQTTFSSPTLVTALNENLPDRSLYRFFFVVHLSASPFVVILYLCLSTCLCWGNPFMPSGNFCLSWTFAFLARLRKCRYYGFVVSVCPCLNVSYPNLPSRIWLTLAILHQTDTCLCCLDLFDVR
jgi:hypothetical protein